jgi:hypothetical protein
VVKETARRFKDNNEITVTYYSEIENFQLLYALKWRQCCVAKKQMECKAAGKEITCT